MIQQKGIEENKDGKAVSEQIINEDMPFVQKQHLFSSSQAVKQEKGGREELSVKESKLRSRLLLLVVVSALILLIIYLALKPLLVVKPSVHRDTNFNCHLHPQYLEYIYKNLEFFNTGITQSMIDRTKELIAKIVIKVTDGELSYYHAQQNYYHEEYMIFLRECAKVLPDSEFTINYLDEPRILKKKWSKHLGWRNFACDKGFQIPYDHSFFKKPCMFEPIFQKAPLFSAGIVSQCFHDIIFPSFHYFPVKKIDKAIDWQQKQFKAIWRGGLTGTSEDNNDCCWSVPWKKEKIDMTDYHRPKLVDLCKKISDCDAGFTEIMLCNKKRQQQYLKKFGLAPFLTLEEQMKFKIIIDIDGYSYSKRFPEVLSTGSAIIKIHTFKDIGILLGKPWIHYIPVKMDLSDLEEKIQWAKDNDEEVRRIANQGLKLSKLYTREQYKCYVFNLISLYAKLFVSEEQYRINERRRSIQEKKDEEFANMCNLDAAFEKQIAQDLAPFRLGIPPSMIETAKEQIGIDIIRIHNHSVEISGSGTSKEQRSFLRDVARYLPDMEFVVNPSTQPRALKYNYLKGGINDKFLCDNGFQRPKHGLFLQPCSWNPIYEFVPVFGPSKVPQCFLDILLPTETGPRLQAGIRWKDKQPGSVWRGVSDGGNFGGIQCQKKKEGGKQIPFQNFHRQRLVEICSKTNNCDVNFTEYSQCSDSTCGKMREMYGKQVEKQAIKDQARHKVIIDIDGNGHSREFVQKLASGSAVLKISSFLDFPLIAAQPWVHFIPVRMDLEDLAKQLQWARDNDEELEKIALRGKELTSKQLDYSSKMCYAIRVLREYSRLLIPEERYRARLKIKQADPSYWP